ncbi:MAG: hypothetical protein ACRCX5_12185 [Bacteroidales bacterium]
MKKIQFEIEVPNGFKCEYVNGIFRISKEDKEEENCPFEVGDVVLFAGRSEALRLFEGVDKHGRILRKCFYDKNTDMFELSENIVLGNDIYFYTKATPEQEKLFKQKCLENGFWFDKANKKWIELKEGNIYNVDGVIELFDRYEKNNKSLYFHCSLYEKLFDLGYVTGFHNIINISEAKEDEKQRLFDALKEKGKQWNADKKCVEDIRWQPKNGDEYWYVSNSFEPIETKYNNCAHDTHLISVGNYFKTKEETLKAIEYIKECWKNYKPE